MDRLNRREFFQHSASALTAATVLSGTVHAAAATDLPGAASKQVLGKTGITSTLLGMGTGTKAWNGSSAQNRRGRDAFVETLIHAYERGLRYYDLADMYGAHDYLRQAMAEASMPREDLMLLTKTVAKDAETCRADLERFRKEADVDYFDVVLLHCMTAADWTETMKPCMDVLAEAKEKGIIRAHGVSCHDFGALKAAAEHPWVDVMLSRINPYGIKMDAEPEEVVPVLESACAAGKGMLGMKIAGEGDCLDRLADSLKYVQGLGCIHAFTIGFVRPEEIDDTIAKIEATA